MEQYRLLLETSAAITASTDLQETLGLITRLVTERLDVAWCDLYDYEAAADEFVVIAFYQLPGDRDRLVGLGGHPLRLRQLERSRLRA